MKTGIHPAYREVTVTCACGETFVTRSTREDLRLEICSKCHPFFTGKQKLIDSAGRVERFEKRYRAVVPKNTAAAVVAKVAGKAARAKTKPAAPPAPEEGASKGADQVEAERSRRP